MFMFPVASRLLHPQEVRCMGSQLGGNREYKDFPCRMPQGRKVWDIYTDNSSGTRLGRETLLEQRKGSAS